MVALDTYVVSLNASLRNSLVQRNLTARVIITSPSSAVGSVPPAVPTVMTSFGLTSSIHLLDEPGHGQSRGARRRS